MSTPEYLSSELHDSTPVSSVIVIRETVSQLLEQTDVDDDQMLRYNAAMRMLQNQMLKDEKTEVTFGAIRSAVNTVCDPKFDFSNQCNFLHGRIKNRCQNQPENQG